MQAFKVVEEFEKRVAEYAGSLYGVAVNTGTSAIFLSLQYTITQTIHKGGEVVLPARTFVSVPLAVMQCGLTPVFDDYQWNGVYMLAPHHIYDGALRFRKGMYQGGLHCLSFQARKTLNIGEGGMILTDDLNAANWLKAARYMGRKPPDYKVESIDSMGWLLYMTPEKAARGLHLMEYVKDDNPDQQVTYPDLREVPLFAGKKRLSQRREFRATA